MFAHATIGFWYLNNRFIGIPEVCITYFPTVCIESGYMITTSMNTSVSSVCTQCESLKLDFKKVVAIMSATFIVIYELLLMLNYNSSCGCSLGRRLCCSTSRFHTTRDSLIHNCINFIHT